MTERQKGCYRKAASLFAYPNAADYIIYEFPKKPVSDLPTLENPTLDNPTLDNPTQLNKDILRTDLSKKERRIVK